MPLVTLLVAAVSVTACAPGSVSPASPQAVAGATAGATGVPRPTITPTPTYSLPSPTPSTPAPTPLPPLTDAKRQSFVCAGREPCRLVAVHSAGTGADGARLAVAEVALHDQDDTTRREYGCPGGTPCRSDIAMLLDPVLDPAMHTWIAYDLAPETVGLTIGECRTYEHWLLRETAAGATRQLLASACNSGYGMSMTGREVVLIGDNRLAHFVSGGSANRWAEDGALRLAPLSRLGAMSAYSNTIIGPEVEQFWRLADDLAGRQRRYTWIEKDARLGGTPKDPATPPRPTPHPMYETVLVPWASLPPEFAAGVCQTTGLAGCAARFDGTHDHGYVLGGAVAPDDAWFAAVVGDDVLYLEIHDDVWTAAEATAAGGGDHLEVWMRPPTSPSSPKSIDDPVDRPRHWTVRLVDGTVETDGPGARAPIVVATAHDEAAGRTMRTRMVLPALDDLLVDTPMTVAYSDWDASAVEERRIATSPLALIDPATLGAVGSVDPLYVDCAIAAGSHAPKPLDPAAEDPAVLGVD